MEPTAAGRRLPHAKGAVSLSTEGPTFTVAIGACPHLDGEQQVVGRVTSGMDVLETLSEAKVDDDFAPFERVHVGTCGACGPGGPRGAAAALAASLRAERAAAAAKRAAEERQETKEETKARLARESDEIGAGIKRSLADGLRKEGEKRGEKKAKKGGMLDAVLGDAPSDDSDDEERSENDE